MGAEAFSGPLSCQLPHKVSERLPRRERTATVIANKLYTELYYVTTGVSTAIGRKGSSVFIRIRTFSARRTSCEASM